jgi:hypothetical protein
MTEAAVLLGFRVRLVLDFPFSNGPASNKEPSLGGTAAVPKVITASDSKGSSNNNQGNDNIITITTIDTTTAKKQSVREQLWLHITLFPAFEF